MARAASCWIPKATNTHKACVIHIAFPLRQWLQERASLLRYSFIACLFITELHWVYCAVRTEALTVIRFLFSLYRINDLRLFFVATSRGQLGRTVALKLIFIFRYAPSSLTFESVSTGVPN